MKKIITPLLALGAYITPVSALLIVQPSWGQTQNPSAQQAQRLLEQGKQQTRQYKHKQAIQTFEQVLTLARELKDQKLQATVLLWLGFTHNKIGERQQALKFYNQSLLLFRAVGDRSQEARTLNNIGGVYDALGQKQEALKFYNQSLPLSRAVGDRSGEAVTLNNIGRVYDDLGQKQEALKFYNQSLPLSRAVGDRSQEATTLGNIGVLYRDTNRPTDAIKNLEQSLKIILEMRQGLQRQNRQKFLEVNDWSAHLVDVLIDQKQYAKAFEWVNLFTTAELADYTRLINAKVTNPQVQRRLDRWNQQNQQLQALRQELQDKFSQELSQQVRKLQTQVYQDAERISEDFPEVAELFETTPPDIAKLKSSIPTGMVVVQPIPLRNSIAVFVLTKNRLNVVEKQIDTRKFEQISTQYPQQVQNDGNSDYIETGSALYDMLIRPAEKEIEALSPKQISIIASGKLRYLPFETLYDKQKRKFLIQKYPVNYLTRISTRSLGSSTAPKHVNRQQAVLALGNPIPRKPHDLPGAEKEIQKITQLFPTSQAYLGKNATLKNLKIYASKFPLLHIATHGCFQEQDCRKLKLANNTLLFADTEFHVAESALLGLQGTQLLTISACQSAKAIEVLERAGAKAVIAGLWTVEDGATQDLMIEFYQNIHQGMSKAEALQKAKLKQIDRHPYFWSPFVLIGDPR